jgi:hypothetical protein
VTTTAGSIELEDRDSATETAPGLRRLRAEAPLGSVTISTGGSVTIESVIATGETGIASVFSSAGNLKVLPGGEIDTVQFTRGIDLRAGQTLRLPKFWTAPDLISYRGTELIFDDLTLDGTGGNVDGRMLPETLVSAKIVLEQRNGLVLDHTTTIDTEWLELNSDGNISVSGLESLRHNADHPCPRAA